MYVPPGTWAFWIERFHDGLIEKFKARFFVQGDRQKFGVNTGKHGLQLFVV